MEVRPGYKQTEVGIIPNDWDVKSVLSLAEVKGRVGWKGYTKSDLRFIGPLAIGAKHIDDSNRLNLNDPTHISYEKYLESPEIMVAFNDILIVQRGTIGKVVLIDNEIGEATINPSMVIVRMKNAIPSYVYYQFVSKTGQNQILLDTSSTGVPMITQKQIGDFLIPYPLLTEQRAIAAALSDADALISGLDQFIAKKRDLKQAAMQQLLTGKLLLPGFIGEWEVKRLGDIAHINMGQSPDSSNYNQSGIGIPLIQGNADIENRKSIRRVWTTQITKTCDEGDLILTVRAPVGSIGVASEHSCLGRGVCSLKPINAHAPFLFHAMVFAESQWKILEQGSTFTAANSAQIAEFPLMIAATLDEQTAIATVLSDMDAELAALEQRRDKTRDLKQGMMQELLTGRIRLV